MAYEHSPREHWSSVDSVWHRSLTEKTAEAKRQEQESAECCREGIQTRGHQVTALGWEQRFLSGNKRSSGLHPGSDFNQHGDQVLRTMSGGQTVTQAGTGTQVQSEEQSGGDGESLTFPRW